MGDERASAGMFEQVVDFFERSRFDYLALELQGASLELSREPRADAPRTGMTTADKPVLASSVGFAEAPAGRKRFAAPGERVEKGEVLFALRRFAGFVPVIISASGTVVEVRVKPGEFVAFGQELARVRTDPTFGQA